MLEEFRMEIAAGWDSLETTETIQASVLLHRDIQGSEKQQKIAGFLE